VPSRIKLYTVHIRIQGVVSHLSVCSIMNGTERINKDKMEPFYNNRGIRLIDDVEVTISH
jgi:hypothetical protein